MIYNEHITNLPNFSRAGLGFELPYTKVMDMIQQAFPNKTIIDSSMLMLFENHYPKIKHYKTILATISTKEKICCWYNYWIRSDLLRITIRK